MVTHTMPIPALPQRKAEATPTSRPASKMEASDSFLAAMLQMPFSNHERSGLLKWFVSLVLHSLVVAALLMAPLYFTDAIDVKAFTLTFLVGPPPPAPPPAATAEMQKVVRAPMARFMQAGRLTAPTVVPKTIAVVKEEPLPPDVGGGVIGGVPGGIPGGQIGGVLGGIIGGEGKSFVPVAIAPPPTPARRVVRVGGQIKPPRPISTPEPAYPTIARAAKVEGTVTITCVIDEHGDVVEARAESGPGLLIPAALKAVSEWRYQPTLLNGEPVAVQMRVFVEFTLH